MDNMIEHPWSELQALIKEKWFTQKAFASILWKKVSEVNELLKWKRNITIQRDYLLHQTLWTPIKYWILKQVDYDYSLLDIEESSNFPLDKEGLGEIWSHPEQSEESTAHPTRHSEAPAEESTTHQTRHSEAPAEESTTHQTRHSEAPAEESTAHQTSHSEHSEESTTQQTSHSETPAEESTTQQTRHSEALAEESTTQQTRHSEALAEESRIKNLTSLDSSTSLRSSLNDNITQNENKSQETLIQKPKIKNEDDFKKRANIFKSF